MQPQTLVTTRKSLHALAEHLLAGDLWRRTGKMGLRVTPGGFGQPESTDGGERRRIRVDGTSIAVLQGDVERWHPATSSSALATFAGTELGPPSGTYESATSLDGDAMLDIDPEAANRLAGWFALVADALEHVRREHAAEEPTIVQLWPEHFDVACTISEVNLGGSPGDAEHPEPYLYVGPWSAVTGSFWNEPWGASISWRDVPDEASAIAFLEDGLGLGTAPFARQLSHGLQH